MFFAILKYSVGSLLYGGLITVIFLSLFIFLIKGWYKDAVFRPISFVVLGILSLIILWNSTLICGALAMKSDVTWIHTLIANAIAASGIDLDATVNTVMASDVFSQVVAQHPILSYYADSCEFAGMTFAELPASMCDTLTDYLNGIIVSKLLWTLGFVVAAAVIVIKTMQRIPTSRTSARSGRSARKGVSSRISGARRRTSRI